MRRHGFAVTFAATMVLLWGSAQAQVPGQFVSDSKTGCKFWWPEKIFAQVVSFRWNGACAAGLASGRATFESVQKYSDGTLVTWTGEGDAVGGKLTGRAFIVSSVGNRTEGEYKDGVLNGRGFFSRQTKTVTERCDGAFRNGKQEGTGVCDKQLIVFSNEPPSIIHEQGEYADGKLVKGILSERIQGCAKEERYEGEFADNAFNGRGTLKAADGTVYSGIWHDGKITINGRLIGRSDIRGVESACGF
ncbi:MAG TPA: hypothetical protein VKY24_11720 [Reyranella sp.]|nr:hypothetical protein [Reyranella sp.]